MNGLGDPVIRTALGWIGRGEQSQDGVRQIASGRKPNREVVKSRRTSRSRRSMFVFSQDEQCRPAASRRQRCFRIPAIDYSEPDDALIEIQSARKISCPQVHAADVRRIGQMDRVHGLIIRCPTRVCERHCSLREHRQKRCLTRSNGAQASALLCSCRRDGKRSRAALKLHVSQPALSAQIRDLEEDVGFTLLERSAKISAAD